MSQLFTDDPGLLAILGQNGRVVRQHSVKIGVKLDRDLRSVQKIPLSMELQYRLGVWWKAQ